MAAGGGGGGGGGEAARERAAREAAEAEAERLRRELAALRAEAEAARRARGTRAAAAAAAAGGGGDEPLPSFPSFSCPLTLTLMRDPVMTSEGHTYERSQIEQWIASGNHTDPLTRNPITTALLPNLALKNAIAEALEAIAGAELPFGAFGDVRRIKAGASKTVHRARFRGGDVALLELRAGGAAEVGEREARVFVELGQHPHLLRFLGRTETPAGRRCLVTEFAQCGSLVDALERFEGRLTLRHRLRIAEHVCAGMKAIHAFPMMHRDLAARNVLLFFLDPDEPARTLAKVTDYGLTLPGTTIDTNSGGERPVRWMAPESIERNRWSTKSDVWAGGVTLWELWTDGRVPYAHNSDEAVSRGVCRRADPLRLPRPEEAECPDAVWALMRRCWARDRRQRPDFAEMARELRRLREALPPPAAGGGGGGRGGMM